MNSIRQSVIPLAKAPFTLRLGSQDGLRSSRRSAGSYSRCFPNSKCVAGFLPPKMSAQFDKCVALMYATPDCPPQRTDADCVAAELSRKMDRSNRLRMINSPSVSLLSPSPHHSTEERGGRGVIREIVGSISGGSYWTGIGLRDRAGRWRACWDDVLWSALSLNED